MGCIASIFCCAAECACCLACRSLFACCGGGKKDGETEATKDAGRCGSMWMMILAMLLSLGVQYYLAKYADFYAWTVGCGDDDGCKGAAGVYRVSFCTATFFLVMALATRASPAFHDGFWGAKFLGWIVLLVISAFVPNYVFDADGYLWVARFGGRVRPRPLRLLVSAREDDEERGAKTGAGSPSVLPLGLGAEFRKFVRAPHALPIRAVLSLPRTALPRRTLS